MPTVRALVPFDRIERITVEIVEASQYQIWAALYVTGYDHLRDDQSVTCVQQPHHVLARE